MRINVGDIVKVIPKDGNGCYLNIVEYEIVNYHEFYDKQYTSGLLLTDHKEQQYVVKFKHDGEDEYRRVYESHIIEIINDNIPEDLTYLIKFMQDKEVI